MRLARAIALFCCGLSAVAVTAQEITEAMLLTQAPQEAISESQTKQFDWENRQLSVDFVRADLDGTRRFKYIVALYCVHPPVDGFVRVFRVTENGIQRIADFSGEPHLGNYPVKLRLVDVLGNGTPFIDLQSSDSNGQHMFHDVLRFSNGSLQRVTDSDEDYSNAFWQDLDGDGVLEFIQPPYTISSEGPDAGKDETYVIFKFNGTEFREQSRGTAAQLGIPTPDQEVVAIYSTLVPGTLTLGEIGTRASKRGSTPIAVVIGSLKTNGGANVRLEDIDPSTIIFGRNLHPLTTQFLRSGKSRFRAEFDRNALIQQLPTLKLDGPLAAGDKLSVRFFAKLKNDRVLETYVPLLIGNDYASSGTVEK